MNTKSLSFLILSAVLISGGFYSLPSMANAQTFASSSSTTTSSSSTAPLGSIFNPIHLGPGPAVCVGGMTTNIITGAACPLVTGTSSSTTENDSTSSPITGYNPGGPLVHSHPMNPLTAFTSNLSIGSTGTGVLLLQQYLNAQGFTIAATGPGSTGNETQYFGAATKAALMKFQAAKGIPATGNYGPITRDYIDAQIAAEQAAQGPGTITVVQSGHPFIPAAGPVTLTGTTTCLSSVNTSGVQNASCALVFEDQSGNLYTLVDTSPTYSNVAGVAENTKVTVQGTFTLDFNPTYNTVGTIAVTSITAL